jgi:hypothetical protein
LEIEQRVRWVKWQHLAAMLEHLPGNLTPGERGMVADLLAVMERRGVRRVFRGIPEEDLWQLAAACRVGAERVYPQIATFTHELRAELADDFDYIATEGISTRRSMAYGQPSGWGTTHLWVPFWPRDCAKPKDLTTAQQFVQFNLYDVTLAVGVRFIFRWPAAIAQKWKSSVAELANGIAQAAPDYDVVASRLYEMHKVVRSCRGDEMDEDVLSNMLQTSDCLALQRSMPLQEAVDVAAIASMVREDRKIVENIPFLRDEAYLQIGSAGVVEIPPDEEGS